MSMHSQQHGRTLTLTEIERGEESCILRFSDGESFRVGVSRHTHPMPMRKM